MNTAQVQAETKGVGLILREAREKLQATPTVSLSVLYFLDSIGKYQLRRLHGDCDKCGKQDCESKYGGHDHEPYAQKLNG